MSTNIPIDSYSKLNASIQHEQQMLKQSVYGRIRVKQGRLKDPFYQYKFLEMQQTFKVRIKLIRYPKWRQIPGQRTIDVRNADSIDSIDFKILKVSKKRKGLREQQRKIQTKELNESGSKLLAFCREGKSHKEAEAEKVSHELVHATAAAITNAAVPQSHSNSTLIVPRVAAAAVASSVSPVPVPPPVSAASILRPNAAASTATTINVHASHVTFNVIAGPSSAIAGQSAAISNFIQMQERSNKIAAQQLHYSSGLFLSNAGSSINFRTNPDVESSDDEEEEDEAEDLRIVTARQKEGEDSSVAGGSSSDAQASLSVNFNSLLLNAPAGASPGVFRSPI